MIGLLCFALAVLASPFKSKLRLEAENAVLRHQLIVLRRKMRGRDQICGAIVTRRLRALGIRDKPIAPASPWQNGFAERLIGSSRRECVDHIIVLGEVHCAGF